MHVPYHQFLMQTLPQTKFVSPTPHRELISRNNLTTWLQQELPASRLVLISAPAGYGKTTLLSGLPQALPQFNLAWLTLDEEDNEIVRFLTGLGEALTGIHPHLKQMITLQVDA